jgi:hypothetical protein
MPLSLHHRYAVLLADCTCDVGTVVTEGRRQTRKRPRSTETALRAAAGQTYLVASSTAGFPDRARYAGLAGHAR